MENWLVKNPCAIVSSDLVRMECLVLPVRNNDTARITEIETFFRSRVAEIRPLTRAVFDRATLIRARTKINTPDALNLAAAVEAGGDVFLTSDQQLQTFTGITVEVI
ncbi:hypothetical protein FTUN_1233 [Frigoriglobus tundricola]|uniref:PIN domain-containing protein n=1 Tax=Frigoriglobus tundricola TaxID=2774151 RepID=A0A6M5YL41_9BACT|nr:hypothetical protein FTUN_1233 [Frigoriglobus tundricola]